MPEYLNDTIRLLYERSSCRSFEDRAIPENVVSTILRAGIHAPTGGNLQPYSIVRITDESVRARLAELTEGQPWVAAAPVNLLFCIDFHRLERWAELSDAPFSATGAFRHFWISFQDTIIAAQNVCTAADAVGLGSVYIGSVLECFRELRSMFALPDGVFPVVLLCLGYPKHRPSPSPKLDIDTIVHDGGYQDPSDEELLAAFHRKWPGKGRLSEPTEERRERLQEAATRTRGEDFARRCLERVDRENRINLAQAYFGLHYCADQMPVGNEDFVRIMEEFGFDWFKRWEPVEA